MNFQSIESLNAKFGNDQVSFQTGTGGLPFIQVKNSHARAEICLQGAHVTRFQPGNEQPILWLSQKSEFAAGQPIRGGIPLCWPWFGPHPENSTRPSHGFARRLLWQVTETIQKSDGTTQIELVLADSPETRKYWDFKFNLSLRISIGTALSLALTTINKDNRSFQITQALHSYFSVGDVSKITISGLEDTDYVDSLTGKIQHQPDSVKISEETDRIYLQTQATCVVNDPILQRKIVVRKSGSNTTVVWNPWIAKSQRMPDFGDAEYKEMICVETTNADADSITLQPGESHQILTEIQKSN